MPISDAATFIFYIWSSGGILRNTAHTQIIRNVERGKIKGMERLLEKHPIQLNPDEPYLVLANSYLFPIFVR